MAGKPKLLDWQSPGADDATSQARVIKKYPNRRLYDTQSSSYITLAEVRTLVMEREEFIVADAKTGDDLTRSVLLQILLEEEAAGEPMFSERALADMIRFYGHTMQGFLRPYLERNIQAMVELQAMMAERSRQLSPENWTRFMRLQSPMMQSAMNEYMEQSAAALLDLQQQMSDQAQQVLGAFGFRR